MKKYLNIIGAILAILNIIYTIMIVFLEWTVKKEIVVPTIILTAIYVLYRLYLDKHKEDS